MSCRVWLDLPWTLPSAVLAELDALVEKINNCLDTTTSGDCPCAETCVTVDLTLDQILALPTTPVDLIAAPGARKRIKVTSVSFLKNFANEAFTNVDAAYAALAVQSGAGAWLATPLINDGGAALADVTNFFAATTTVSDLLVPAVFPNTAGQWMAYVTPPTLLTAVENQPVQLAMDNNGTGDLLDGLGACLRVIICYRVEDIPACAVPTPVALCSDAAQANAPAAAVGVSLTPSVTPWANSAFVAVFTPSQSVALAAILWDQPDMGWTEPMCDFDVATGAPGSEVVIGTLAAQAGFSSFTGMNEANFPVPLGPIAAGTTGECPAPQGRCDHPRVAVRAQLLRDSRGGVAAHQQRRAGD
jgi:hypothetical protein